VKEEVGKEDGEGKREEMGKGVEWELVRNRERVRVSESDRGRELVCMRKCMSKLVRIKERVMV